MYMDLDPWSSESDEDLPSFSSGDRSDPRDTAWHSPRSTLIVTSGTDVIESEPEEESAPSLPTPPPQNTTDPEPLGQSDARAEGSLSDGIASRPKSPSETPTGSRSAEIDPEDDFENDVTVQAVSLDAEESFIAADLLVQINVAMDGGIRTRIQSIFAGHSETPAGTKRLMLPEGTASPRKEEAWGYPQLVRFLLYTLDQRSELSPSQCDAIRLQTQLRLYEVEKQLLSAGEDDVDVDWAAHICTSMVAEITSQILDIRAELCLTRLTAESSDRSS